MGMFVWNWWRRLHVHVFCMNNLVWYFVTALIILMRFVHFKVCTEFIDYNTAIVLSVTSVIFKKNGFFWMGALQFH